MYYTFMQYTNYQLEVDKTLSLAKTAYVYTSPGVEELLEPKVKKSGCVEAMQRLSRGKLPVFMKCTLSCRTSPHSNVWGKLWNET